MWDQSVLGSGPVNRAHLMLHYALRMVTRAGFGFLLGHRLLASPGPSDLVTEPPKCVGASYCNWEPEYNLSRAPCSLLVLLWGCTEEWMLRYLEGS